MENEIRVTIDGIEVTLLPSLNAAIKLSDRYGGFLPLLDVLNVGSLEAATDVIFWTLGKKDSERASLREQVYSAGLAYLTPHLVRYVIALMHGGRVQPPTKAAADA